MPKPSSPQVPPTSPSTAQPRAVAALRLSTLPRSTTAPGRQRAAIQLCTERLDFTLIGEASDLGVSARKTYPFERPSLSSWLRRPAEYDAVVWSHVDRAVRSVAHMAELITWGRQHDRTLVFGMPETNCPLLVTRQADGATIRRCMDLAFAAEQEVHSISTLMGHRVHRAHTVRDAVGDPVLIGPPLLTEDEFYALQEILLARSNGTHRTRRMTTALLTGVAHCAGCGGRMYFAARKGYPHGDYACRATARGEVCPAPAGMRSDWLEEYTVDRYRRTAPAEANVTRERLLRRDVRVTVAKGRSGGGPTRLTFTIGD